MTKEIQNKVKGEYAEFKKTKAILDKVKALLDQYGTSGLYAYTCVNPEN
jgi:NAD+--asparagine ADP-ribosyltransferase